jgi:hypothetical protein
LGAQYLPAAPAGTRTTSPACASTTTPPDSTKSWPSITKLYSLCGCSSAHDSAVSSHSNSRGSDQPPLTGGTITLHFGLLPFSLKSVRENFFGELAASVIALFPLDGSLATPDIMLSAKPDYPDSARQVLRYGAVLCHEVFRPGDQPVPRKRWEPHDVRRFLRPRCPLCLPPRQLRSTRSRIGCAACSAAGKLSRSWPQRSPGRASALGKAS